MAKASSHHIDKRRFPGEREGAIVASFLNNERAQRAKQRILSLLDLLRRLFASGTYRSGYLTPRPSEIHLVMEAVELFNRLASRYKAAPRFLEGRGRKEPRVTNLFTWRLEEVSCTNNPAFREFEAAFLLIDLAKNQLLNSLRKCRSCSRWFFARFSHQWFCSDKCRVRHNASFPEAKDYRAKKAQEYYWGPNHPARGLQKYRKFRHLPWQQFRETILASKRKKDNHGHI